ncbi:MAG: ATP-binding cassette domain-containing protein [Bacteroidales bacterium]|nr:ATP-binding cassette domain-containing protein [Bacteroidales bacterium]
MNNTILHINSVSKSFSHSIKKLNGDVSKEEYCVLDKIDLQVQKGKITAIIGSNGAGKTTLFNIVSGLLNTDKGELFYTPNGKKYNLRKISPYKLARIGIGRMFQDNHIFPKLTVMENMLIADTDPYGENAFTSFFYHRKKRKIEKERKLRAEQIFEMLFGKANPFCEKQEDYAETLSYGQQRLLGLARLFMGNYKLVLLDEPTAGVNPVLVKKIAEIIRKMVDKRQMTILLIEHNMPFVESLADLCVFINTGKIETAGSVVEVLDNPHVRENYLGKRTTKRNSTDAQA